MYCLRRCLCGVFVCCFYMLIYIKWGRRGVFTLSRFCSSMLSSFRHDRRGRCVFRCLILEKIFFALVLPRLDFMQLYRKGAFLCGICYGNKQKKTSHKQKYANKGKNQDFFLFSSLESLIFQGFFAACIIIKLRRLKIYSIIYTEGNGRGFFNGS